MMFSRSIQVCLFIFTTYSFRQMTIAQNLGRVQVSKEVEVQVIRSQSLGKKLYQNDQASAAATDVLLSKKILEKDKSVKGWVTVEKDDSWLIRFINDKNLAVYDVTLPKGDFKNASLKINENGKSLSPSELKMFLARQLVINQPFQKCAENINTIVIDAKVDGKKGFLVYLFAASKNPEDVYFGGNHLFHVSPDGEKIIETRGFSKSCVTVSKKDVTKGQQSKGLYITHILNDYPTEVHVFLSFLHKAQIFVGTQSYSWLVEEDIISAFKKR